MKINLNKIAFWILIIFLSLPLNAKTDISALLEELTLQELTGQTIMTRLVTGEQKYYKDAIEKGYITGVFLKTKEGFLNNTKFTPEEQEKYIKQQRALTIKTIKDLRKWEKKSPHKIPLIIAFDYEGGPVTSATYMGLKPIPSNMLIGAAGDENLTEEMYKQMALEVKSLDGQMIFGPVLDLNTNPKNPIIGARSFGDDSKKVATLGLSAVKGLQEENVAAFVKHFPGHGDVAVDSHYGVPVSSLSLSALQEHINAFVPPLEQGVWGALVCHVIYPLFDKENTASFSNIITTGLLKDKIGFNGVIATDDLGMKGSTEGNTTVQTVLRAYNAGADLLLLSGDIKDVKTASKYPQLAINYVTEIEGKEIEKERIKESAKKILELKQKTGLFDKKQNVKFNEEDFYVASKKIAQKGITLAKNQDDLIPLPSEDKNICTLFFADPIFGAPLQEFNNTLTQAGKQVQSYIGEQTPTAQDRAYALQCAKNKDIVIIGSLQRYTAIKEQKDLIEEVLKTAPKAILISLLSPYDILLYPQAKAILAVYGPTEESMQVTAQIILGNQKAEGKLPVKLK